MSHHGKHGYPITKQMRIERRERAAAIAEESGYSKLSLQEKLARLPADGAKKQRARLERQIAEAANTTKKVAAEPVVQEAEAVEKQPVKQTKKHSKKEGK